MNRYDYGFRALPAFIRANASQRVSAARGGLIQHRSNGFGPEDDEAIVRQFDLSGMAEFWEVELSEPMECEAFAHTLAIHFLVITERPSVSDEDRKKFGPAAMCVVDGMRAGVRKALRDARSYSEPWFMDIPAPAPNSKLDENYGFGFVPRGIVVVPPEPPSDGIDLSKLRVRPRAAVEWMLASPKRRHLVPPSLAATFQVQISTALPKPLGRTKGTGFAKADESLADRMNKYGRFWRSLFALGRSSGVNWS